MLSRIAPERAADKSAHTSGCGRSSWGNRKKDSNHRGTEARRNAINKGSLRLCASVVNVFGPNAALRCPTSCERTQSAGTTKSLRWGSAQWGSGRSPEIKNAVLLGYRHAPPMAPASVLHCYYGEDFRAVYMEEYSGEVSCQKHLAG